MPLEKNKRYYELHADLCKTIANAKRLQILDLLRTGELSVHELAQLMEAREANVSQHLSLMRQKGILATRREGVTIYYHIANPKVLQAYDIMTEVLYEQVTKDARTVESMHDPGASEA
ncbi:MAG: transcriptional regulator [Chloroflexi bacterium]|nr:MAG: transcriptional regulator [Chloroflexota bacterium]